MPRIRRDKQCALWWCDQDTYGQKDYCVRHLRQYERTGDPLVGDAQPLYHACERAFDLLERAQRELKANTGDVCKFCGNKAYEAHAWDCLVAQIADFLLQR